MIEVKNLHKSFPEKPGLIDGISFHIYPCTLTVVTGKSGSGKTTLLKLIRGEIAPDKGRIKINNKDINRLRNKSIRIFRQKTGIVYQEPKLLDDRSVVENIALPLRIAGIHGTVLRSRVEKMLELFSLTQFAFTFAGKMSGGERQKISIARALVSSPRILLLDEPASGLDPDSREEFATLIHSLPTEENITIIVATHNSSLLENLGVHGILTLKNGKIVSEPQANLVQSVSKDSEIII
ncbi:MAG: cell division ATP-binding protein FtsE [Myxococcota bacterium]